MDGLLYISLPIIIVFLHLFHHFVFHRLRNLPPTPFPALPIVGHLHLLRKPPLHKALYDVGKRYGQVLFLRFGSRPVVLVSSAAAAEECFTKNDIVFANRPKLLTGKHLGYNFTSLPFSPYGERWRNLRRISTVEVLSSYRIQQLAGIRAEEVKELVRNLFHLSTCDPMVVLKPPLHDFTFNVMSRMIFGKKYYGGGAAVNSEAAKLFQEISRNQIRVIPKANVLDFLPFMRWFGFGDIEDELARIFEKRDGFMQRVIDDHRSGLSHGGRRRDSTAADCKTVLDVLLELQSSEPETYTDETIRNLLLVLLQGGSDTTAVTLEWAFSYLLDNPQVLSKAQSDMEKHVGNHRIVDESDLPHVPYIRCIVNETLRMHPAAPLLLPHFASEDSTISGFHIPRETILVVNAWGIHRDPRVWVEPEVFSPDRWFLEGGGGGGGRNNGCGFIPFGSGRRRCPGENLALRVLELTLASLLQCFEWDKVDDNIETKESDGTGGFTVSAMTHPLLVQCSPRPLITNLFS